MADEILAPTTSGATTNSITFQGNELPGVIAVPVLAGSEEAKVQRVTGTTPKDIKRDGSTLKCTANHNEVDIFWPGVYVVVKDATASASGVYKITPDNP